MSYQSTATQPVTETPAVAKRAFSILIGLTALAVLLQGLWAGLFIHEGEDYKDSWVQVHARGADLAILLAIIATVVAAMKFRQRKDLLVGTAVLAVCLIIEAYIGGLIGDSPGASVVHIPLAMALMALSVWLPLRARTL